MTRLSFDLKVWYVIHPIERVFPDIEKYLAEVESILINEFPNCILRRIPCDAFGKFRIASVKGCVVNQRGPILVIEPVQRQMYYYLRQSLEYQVPVDLVNVTDSTDLYERLLESAKLFREGEPQLARPITGGRGHCV